METTPRSEMRILTVRQPWAWAIIHGGKDVENRVRNIAGDYRGPIAIHSGLAVFEEEGGAYPEVVRAIESEIQGYRVDDQYLWEVADDADPEDPRYIYGAILGVVDLVDVHSAPDCYRASIGKAAELYRTDRGAFDRLPVTSNVGGLIGRASVCSPWGESAGQHLVLTNPRALAQPIPYRGALGLRRLDADTIAQIEEKLA